jgi:glycosyltransferase involved in cell wall biosynthesis
VDRGAKKEKVEVNHNGRSIEEYSQGDSSPRLYEELGLSPQNTIIGTVGRLVRRKGHYDLLDAWPKIAEVHPEARLLIVGDGPEYEGLIRRARSLDCEDSVCFAGKRDDVPNMLDMMDIFVFPSHFEGLPGALIEAMIAGLPIIATPVDGNSELITDEETGILTPVNDSTALEKNIISLIEDKDKRESISRRAKTFARSSFSKDQMISKFDRLYNRKLNESNI